MSEAPLLDETPELSVVPDPLAELKKRGFTFHELDNRNPTEGTGAFYVPTDDDVMSLGGGIRETAPEYTPISHDDAKRLNLDELRSRLGDVEELSVIVEELAGTLNVQRTMIRLEILKRTRA